MRISRNLFVLGCSLVGGCNLLPFTTLACLQTSKTNRNEQVRIQDTCNLAPNTVNCVQILIQLQLDYGGAYSGTARFE